MFGDIFEKRKRKRKRRRDVWFWMALLGAAKAEEHVESVRK